jgi:hypothetical protein
LPSNFVLLYAFLIISACFLCAVFLWRRADKLGGRQKPGTYYIAIYAGYEIIGVVFYSIFAFFSSADVPSSVPIFLFSATVIIYLLVVENHFKRMREGNPEEIGAHATPSSFSTLKTTMAGEMGRLKTILRDHDRSETNSEE